MASSNITLIMFPAATIFLPHVCIRAFFMHNMMQHAILHHPFCSIKQAQFFSTSMAPYGSSGSLWLLVFPMIPMVPYGSLCSLWFLWFPMAPCVPYGSSGSLCSLQFLWFPMAPCVPYGFSGSLWFVTICCYVHVHAAVNAHWKVRQYIHVP